MFEVMHRGWDRLATSIRFSLLLQLCLLSSCGGSANQTRDSVAWGGPRNICLLEIAAQEADQYAQVGLQSSATYLQTGKLTLDAVLRGELDIGVVTDVNVAYALFQGPLDIAIVAVTQTKYDDGIVGRADKGVRTPRDLIGKRLGITRGTNSEYFAFLFSKTHDIPWDQVETVNLTPQAAASALIGGDLDAACLWQPNRYGLEQSLGASAVVFRNEHIYRGLALIAVSNRVARERSAVVQRFLTGLLTRESSIAQGDKNTVAALSRVLEIPEEAMRGMLPDYEVRLFIDATIAKQLEDTAKWIISTDSQFAGRDVPDYGKLINGTLLAAVAPERVKL